MHEDRSLEREGGEFLETFVCDCCILIREVVGQISTDIHRCIANNQCRPDRVVHGDVTRRVPWGGHHLKAEDFLPVGDRRDGTDALNLCDVCCASVDNGLRCLGKDIIEATNVIKVEVREDHVLHISPAQTGVLKHRLDLPSIPSQKRVDDRYLGTSNHSVCRDGDYLSSDLQLDAG